MLCAAVTRVLHPGTKFDTMVVLSGPQGIGKSTLVAKLGRQWFSDSMKLSNVGDKSSVENLQGFWIIEFGELAGLKKAEVETLRSFLSRQNDIYREAYGRHSESHPRQCIFFGTTNAENGYLRDTTGNRRFWPVSTTGKCKKRSWNISDFEIDQIWAEVLELVNDGESLILSHEEVLVAEQQQRNAMETDDREGLVIEYLSKLLPGDWYTMDINARRNYLNGGSITNISVKGTKHREKVCPMEVWCECFSQDKANITRFDSNNIISILKKLGWTKKDGKERIPIYGPQGMYIAPNTNADKYDSTAQVSKATTGYDSEHT